ncbi:MAG: glucuronyl hydrolase [Epulopiscium sp.]|nr:glucuronyl hydrolase [Candidatus Epulonipiscium sp.]
MGIKMKKIIDEGIQDKIKYTTSCGLTQEDVEQALQEALKKVDNSLEYFTHQFPHEYSTDNIYPPTTNDWGWGQGFWTGIIWLAYEMTEDKKYREVAEIHVKSFEKRIEEKLGVNHHDMGFLYSLSCVAAYRLTGNESAKNAALKAADHLISRYRDKGGFIQAWGDINDPTAYRLIIDCLMNIPLLYWAAEVTKDNDYYKKAYNHMKATVNNVFREDASAFHTFYFDPETGEPVKGVTHQGHSDDSAWARGQAWGMYGVLLSYLYTKDEDLIELYKKVTNYFLNRLPEDYVSYWDLDFTSGEEPRDSSAAAIALCSLLEINKWLEDSDPLKETYLNAANCILKSLIENYSTKNHPKSNGLLLHAVYSKPGNVGVDECNIWGDYFYMEALVRVLKDWELYW